MWHAIGVSRTEFVTKQDAVCGAAASEGVRPLDTTGLANLALSILETDWAENQDKTFRFVELELTFDSVQPISCEWR